MTIWSWLFMAFSWVLILGLTTYCFWRTFSSEEIDVEEEDIKAG